jgi:erythromycin esterase
MTDDTTTTAQHAQRTDALADHAAPLNGTAPGLDTGNLAAFADATFVGLGEATHGSREFFQLKHRFVRYLVEEEGCRAFALEANFSEALALNDYVVDGDGDPRDALDAIYFWTWNVESVLALVEWLRAFNADRPREDRVRFFGVDAQYTQGPVDALREFFADVDPEFRDAIGDELAAAADDGTPPQQEDDTQNRATAADRVASEIQTRLDARGDEYAAATSEGRVALARQHRRVLEQAADYKRQFPEDPTDTTDMTYASIRDEAMADNAEWVREFTGTDTLPVWAHDAHVARTGLQFGDGCPSLGQHLAERHGDDYWALGFAFARGGFQAYDTAEDTETKLVRHALADPIEDTIEATLDDALGSPAVVDLRAAREDDRLREWLAARPHFATGAGFDPTTDPAEELLTYDYTDAFDALAFVPETTRARPVED